MKKIFSMLMMASVVLFGAVSCESEGYDVTISETNFLGTLEGDNGFTLDPVNFKVTAVNEELTIEMLDVQFNAYMPAMDITISGITIDEEYGSFYYDSIIPSVSGVEMSSYELTYVEGEYVESTSFHMTFQCSNIVFEFYGEPGAYTVSQTFVGDLNVGSGAYTDDAASFDVTTTSNSISIMMNQIKFSNYMPVTLDILISDMVLYTDGSFSAASIVPTVSDTPMEAYTMTNVSGTYSDSALTLQFTCYEGQTSETTATFSGTR